VPWLQQTGDGCQQDWTVRDGECCPRARAGAENAGMAWQCLTHTNCGLAPVDADKGGGKQGSGSMGAVLLVRM